MTRSVKWIVVANYVFYLMDYSDLSGEPVWAIIRSKARLFNSEQEAKGEAAKYNLRGLLHCEVIKVEA